MKSVANFTQESIGRFWASVDKTEGGCWRWKLSLNVRDGYGQLNRGGTVYRAHRVAYELANGPIPEGYDIDHRCHNRACVNPSHLRAVTRKQNLEHIGAVRSNTGVRGVHYIAKKRRFKAAVRHNNRTYHCGLHLTLAEAEAAAIAKRNELFTHNDADRAVL